MRVAGYAREVPRVTRARSNDETQPTDVRLEGGEQPVHESGPQQQDPRTGKLRAYETQLLEIQNDNFTHTSSSSPRILEHADFSDVRFYDACD